MNLVTSSEYGNSEYLCLSEYDFLIVLVLSRSSSPTKTLMMNYLGSPEINKKELRKAGCSSTCFAKAMRIPSKTVKSLLSKVN